MGVVTRGLGSEADKYRRFVLDLFVLELVVDGAFNLPRLLQELWIEAISEEDAMLR